MRGLCYAGCQGECRCHPSTRPLGYDQAQDTADEYRQGAQEANTRDQAMTNFERKTPVQRVLASARVRGSRKVVDITCPRLRVEGLPLLVNHSIHTWHRLAADTLEVGMEVNLRVRHLVLDQGTPDERHVWDAQVIGDVL